MRMRVGSAELEVEDFLGRRNWRCLKRRKLNYGGQFS